MHKVFFSFVIPIWLAVAVANNLGDVPMIANGDATNQRHFSAGNNPFIPNIKSDAKKISNFGLTSMEDSNPPMQRRSAKADLRNITKTCPCNILQFFTAVKMIIFR